MKQYKVQQVISILPTLSSNVARQYQSTMIYKCQNYAHYKGNFYSPEYYRLAKKYR